MAFLNLFSRKLRKRSGGHLRPGQKVQYEATVAYNPQKKNIGKRPHIHARKNPIKWKQIGVAILGLIIIGLIGFGIDKLLNSDNLQVKNFELLGNRTINDTQVLAVLDKYRSKNILTINTTTIENDLKTEFNIFNGVRVIKYYPDTLEVRISEREPRLVYVDFSGAFLVDADGKVLQQIYLDPIVVPDEKINIARGYGDVTSDYLKGIYLNDFIVKNNLLDATKLEQEAAIAQGFNFETIDTNTREAKLNELKTAYINEFYAIWDKIDQAVDSSNYSTYARVESMDDFVYKSDTVVDLDRLDLTTDLQTLFSARNIVINRTVWEGELLVRFITADNKQLVFSTDRKVSDQFEDYLLVLNQLQKEGRNYCQMDLSATKIAVKACK